MLMEIREREVWEVCKFGVNSLFYRYVKFEWVIVDFWELLMLWIYVIYDCFIIS